MYRTKKCYFQAQLAVVYSIAVQLTGSEVYTETVQDILGYVSRDLTHPLGGFFTAEVPNRSNFVV